MLGGLLGGLVQQQPGAGAPQGLLGTFDQNQMAMAMMGMGLLSGNDNRDAFRLAMQGAMQGRQFDVQQNTRRALAQVLQNDQTIPANLRPLLGQMDPRTALEWYTSERNYNRQLDEPILHNDQASGQTIVTTRRQLQSRLGGQGGPPAPGAPAPTLGGQGLPPLSRDGAPQQPAPGAPQPQGNGLGVPLVTGPPRSEREARERQALADQMGLQGEDRRQFILTGRYTGTPPGYENDPSRPGALRPIPGGPATQPPPGFENDPTAPEGQRRLRPIAGGAETRVPGEQGARMGMADNFLREYPDIRRQIERGAFDGIATRAGMAAGQIMGETGRGTFGQTNQTYRAIQSGVDALIRNLTGAGMPDVEARRYAERYLPGAGDSRENILDKLDRLHRELRSVEGRLMEGRGGEPRPSGNTTTGGNRSDPLGIRR